jgi:hypothetical protein
VRGSVLSLSFVKPDKQDLSHAPEMALANYLVVVCVCANPEPHDSVRGFNSHRSIIEAHTSGVVSPYLFEMQGRVLRVRLQECKSFVGLFTDWSGEGIIAGPKLW